MQPDYRPPSVPPQASPPARPPAPIRAPLRPAPSGNNLPLVILVLFLLAGLLLALAAITWIVVERLGSEENEGQSGRSSQSADIHGRVSFSP